MCVLTKGIKMPTRTSGFPCGSDGKKSSLGWEDPLEEGMVTHSIILAWKSSWAEEPGRLQPMGSQKRWTWLSNETTATQWLNLTTFHTVLRLVVSPSYDLVISTHGFQGHRRREKRHLGLTTVLCDPWSTADILHLCLRSSGLSLSRSPNNCKGWESSRRSWKLLWNSLS